MKFYLLFVVIGFLLPNFVFGQQSKFCSKNEDCKIENSNCKDGLCVCDVGKIFNSDGSKCLELVPELGIACTEDTQCSALIRGSSTCNNGFCTCSSGYVFSNDTCVKYRKMSEKCSEDTVCYDGVDLLALKCQNGVCVCNDGYYLRGEYDCRKSAKDDGKCFFNSDCENPEQYCNFKWGPTGNCAFAPNTRCRRNEECDNMIKNSFCAAFRENKCTCNDGYTYDKDKNICTLEPSRKDIINNNSPVEVKNTVKDNLVLINLNTTCTGDSDCINIRNSFCPKFRNKCTCKETFVYDKNSGHCVRAVGSPCFNSQNSDEPKCGVKHSFCNEDNVCQCNKYFIHGPLGNKCFKPVREFQKHSCGSNENCFSFGPDSICSNGICVCNANSKYNETYQYCKPVKSSGNDECDNNCKDIPHSTCVKGECVCNDNYLKEDSKCTPDLGFACNAEENDCTVQNATCRNGNCQCSDKFFQTDKRECMPVISIEDKCQSDKQCAYILQESVCFNETCTCSSNYTLLNNKCTKIRSYSDSCNSLTDCKTMKYNDNVSCINGKCVCDFNFHLTEDKLRCVADNGVQSVHQQIHFILGLVVTTILLLN